MKKLNRRSFLQTAAVGSIASLSLGQILSACTSMVSSPKIKLKQGQPILFQGDSITDAVRHRDNMHVNNSHALGTGYAFLTAAALLNTHAQKLLKIYNRGIGGNKVYQLIDRWQADCIDIKPDVLSILIGVNDYWHTKLSNYSGTVDVYENDYRKLLTTTKQQLPDTTLIICEPFAINGTSAVNDNWFPEFDKYRAAAKKIADEFNAVFIPFQSIFNEAQKHAPNVYWSEDGIHPGIAGAQLMAEAWQSVIEKE